MCIKGYIGLKHCSNTTPVSGRYVNELRGITTELVNSVSTKEQVNFKGVWDDIEEHTNNSILQDIKILIREERIIHFFSDLYKSKPIQLINPSQFHPVTTLQTGVYLKIPDSEYLVASIPKIEVFSSLEQVNVPLHIIDLSGNITEHSEVVNLQAGYNRIEINRELVNRFSGQEYFIGLQLTEEIRECTYNGMSSNYSECSCDDDTIMIVQPALFNSSLDNNYDSLTFEEKNRGVHVHVRLFCDLKKMVCEKIDTFQDAIMYKLGYQLLLEKTMTTRRNIFTYSNLEKTESLIEAYDKMYQQSIVSALYDIEPYLQDICTGCRNIEQFRYDSVIP